MAVDAIAGIVAAFQKHEAVIIGENHWLRQAGDFYISLVQDQRFQDTVQDIVVEFVSRNNQPLQRGSEPRSVCRAPRAIRSRGPTAVAPSAAIILQRAKSLQR